MVKNKFPLQEVYKGTFWNKTRFYIGKANSAGGTKNQDFLIDADYFDRLPDYYQETVYKRKYAAAFKKTLNRKQ